MQASLLNALRALLKTAAAGVEPLRSSDNWLLAEHQLT